MKGGADLNLQSEVPFFENDYFEGSRNRGMSASSWGMSLFTTLPDEPNGKEKKASRTFGKTYGHLPPPKAALHTHNIYACLECPGKLVLLSASKCNVFLLFLNQPEAAP